MLRHLGVRATQQEHVGRLVGHRGEHLLTVDHPFVAVALGARLHGCDVGPGVGFAVAEAAEDLAREDARQHLTLLVGRAAHQQRRPDHGGDTHAVDRCACVVQLLHQRGRVDRAAAESADLGRPTGCEVPAIAQRTVELPVVHGARLVRAREHRCRQVLADERAHLRPERLGVVVEPEVEQPSRLAAPQPVGDDLQLATRIAQTQAPRLGSSEVELHVVLEHESVPAVEVQARGSRVLRDRTAEHEGLRRPRRRCGLGLVEGAHRVPGEEGGAGDRGLELGEPVLDHLERADRHAELVAVLHVLDPELERGACKAGERDGRECAPLVDGTLERLACRRTGVDDGRPRRRHASHRAEVDGCHSLVGGCAARHDEILAVECHDRARACRAGDERGPLALPSDRVEHDHVVVKHLLQRLVGTDGGEQASGGHRLEQRHRAEMGTVLLGDDGEIGERCATTAGALREAHRHGPELREAAPQALVEAGCLRVTHALG